MSFSSSQPIKRDINNTRNTPRPTSPTEQWINVSSRELSPSTKDKISSFSFSETTLSEIQETLLPSNVKKTIKSFPTPHPNLSRPDRGSSDHILVAESGHQLYTSMSNKTQVQGKERVEQEKDRLARKGQEVKSTLTPIKIYLLAYNAISALLWGHLLYITLLFIFTPRSNTQVIENSSATSLLSKLLPSSFTSTLSSKVTPKPVQELIQHFSGSYEFHGLGYKTKYIQSLAILEVVHAALGWVRSPLGTVASQVASRVWTVWGVVEAVPEVTHSSPLFTTMLFAWSLTEVIRYTFYFLSLLNIQSSTLNYLRYTTFIPLYPIGASSEAFLSFSTLPPLFTSSSVLVKPIFTLIGNIISNLPSKPREIILKTNLGRNLLWYLAKSNLKSNVAKTAANTTAGLSGGSTTWGLMEFVRLGLFVIWWPALYVLYTYMFKQRRKVLGKGRGKVVGGSNKAR